MPRTRQAVAEELASDLHELEEAAEFAFRTVARFNAHLPDHRRTARLSLTTGRNIYAAGLKAQAAAVDMQAALTTLHGELDRLRADLRLQPVVAGVGEDKPPKDNEATPWSFPLSLSLPTAP